MKGHAFALVTVVCCAFLVAVFAAWTRFGPTLKRWLFVRRLARAENARAVVVDVASRQVVMETNRGCVEEAKLYCRDVGAVVDAVLADGERGLGATYITGVWASPDLRAVATLACHEGFDALLPAVPGYKRRGAPAGKRGAALTRRYDVGREFAEAVLDARFRSASLGLFGPGGGGTLEEAQERKVAAVVALVGAGQSVLEVGCGFGGVARAIEERVPGARVDALTSCRYERDAAVHKGVVLGDCVTLDRVTGPYDRIVCLDTLPRVGRRNLAAFFKRVAALLADGGVAFFQTLVSTRSRTMFDRGSTAATFIADGVVDVPRVEWLAEPLRRAGLVMTLTELHGGEAVAPNYAAWRENLAHAQRSIVASHGTRLYRAYTYHMCMCEAACLAGHLQLAHITVKKSS